MIFSELYNLISITRTYEHCDREALISYMLCHVQLLSMSLTYCIRKYAIGLLKNTFYMPFKIAILCAKIASKVRSLVKSLITVLGQAKYYI